MDNKGRGSVDLRATVKRAGAKEAADAPRRTISTRQDVCFSGQLVRDVCFVRLGVV